MFLNSSLLLLALIGFAQAETLFDKLNTATASRSFGEYKDALERISKANKDNGNLRKKTTQLQASGDLKSGAIMMVTFTDDKCSKPKQLNGWYLSTSTSTPNCVVYSPDSSAMATFDGETMSLYQYQNGKCEGLNL